MIKKTSWKYFDVFFINLMNISLERALPSNKRPPLCKPEIKRVSRALTQVNTVFYVRTCQKVKVL